MTRKDVLYFAGLAASIVTALAAQAHAFPEEYRAPLTIAGLVATAVTGTLAKSPHDL